jgi:hypothetical protein
VRVFEICAAAQLRILFFWDMTPRQWVIRTFQLTNDAPSYTRRTKSSKEQWICHAFPMKNYENEKIICGM